MNRYASIHSEAGQNVMQKGENLRTVREHSRSPVEKLKDIMAKKQRTGEDPSLTQDLQDVIDGKNPKKNLNEQWGEEPPNLSHFFFAPVRTSRPLKELRVKGGETYMHVHIRYTCI